jgi:hypothetical protein
MIFESRQKDITHPLFILVAVGNENIVFEFFICHKQPSLAIKENPTLELYD